VADQFESAHERGDDDVPRDRWGRYLLPHPETGKKTAWTRATTFAKSISDTFALSQWSQRMVAKGLTLRPDLLSLTHTLDVKKDKDKLNQVCEDAKSAAGNKVAANLGTARHSFTEELDRGAMTVADMPEEVRGDIAAYEAAMRTAGVRVVDGMIERQVVLPTFEVGGTFDRILSLDSIKPWFRTALLNAGYGGTYDNGTAFLNDEMEVIGDVKTGQDLQYGWNEIAIQLATYARAARTAGVWDRKTKTWLPPRPVRLDFALVMHLPVEQKTCTLWAVDLAEAMEALELCQRVRRWRKMRNLATPLERTVADEAGSTREIQINSTAPTVAPAKPIGLDTPVVEVHAGLSWLQRFQVAGSRGELSALFKAAVAAGVWSDTLKQAGVDRLKILEEKAG
jgi:hypothetical protein